MILSRQFVAKLLVFSIPVTLIFTAPIGLAYHTGELMPVNQVIAMQMENEPSPIYHPHDDNTIFAYKFWSILTREPEILVLGSSRSLQVRAELMTHKPEAFYNGGAQAWRLQETKALLNHFDDTHHPDVIMLVVDLDVFNGESRRVDQVETAFRTADFRPDRVLSGSAHIIEKMSAGEFSLQNALHRRDTHQNAPALGVKALSDAEGYREDGSYHNGTLLIYPDSSEGARWDDFQSTVNGEGSFEHGTTLNATALDLLDDLLQMAHDRNITVIGYSPPYTPEIYDLFLTQDQHAHIFDAPILIEEIFGRYGYHYFNFSDPRALGSTEEELYDGWHATEKLNVRMYLVMVRMLPDILGEYADPAVLEQILHISDNPIDVFGASG